MLRLPVGTMQTELDNRGAGTYTYRLHACEKIECPRRRDEWFMGTGLKGTNP